MYFGQMDIELNNHGIPETKKKKTTQLISRPPVKQSDNLLYKKEETVELEIV